MSTEPLFFSAAASLLGNDSGTGNASRGVNALHRRAQQLKRWQEIEEQLSKAKLDGSLSINVKTRPKIKFSNSTLFLASCASNDYEECKRLLENNLVNINCVNVDGLTALHQACIDDNIEMVQFLLDHGADINCCDNEGWTPLHATSSCGHASIAKLLLNHGADLTIINNDGELAQDIADSVAIEEMINSKLKEWDIYDVESLRKQEQLCMLKDLNEWIRTGVVDDKVHSRSGATILHVASAKGYIDIISTLLANRTLRNQLNIDARDFEGWTPLAAACYWQQPGSVQILIQNNADVNIKTTSGQRLEDLTDHELILKLIEERRKKLIEEQKIKEQMIINGPQPKVVPPSPPSAPTPPTESETQRKAHAKRVRETRRSTQGISLDDVNRARDQLKQAAVSFSENYNTQDKNVLKSEDNQNGSEKKKLNVEPPEPPLLITSVEPSSPDSPLSTDVSNIYLIRRRRPKKRSTGANNLNDVKDVISSSENSNEKNFFGIESQTFSNINDAFNSTQNQVVDNQSLTNEEKKYTPPTTSPSSTSSSTSSLAYRSRSSSRSSIKDEESEKDWKKMYEDLLIEYENLKKEHQKKEQEWSREKRTLQRKLSELEEEVKQMEPHKSENQKLKDENAALIRVISKLSK